MRPHLRFARSPGCCGSCTCFQRRCHQASIVELRTAKKPLPNSSAALWAGPQSAMRGKVSGEFGAGSKGVRLLSASELPDSHRMRRAARYRRKRTVSGFLHGPSPDASGKATGKAGSLTSAAIWSQPRWLAETLMLWVPCPDRYSNGAAARCHVDGISNPAGCHRRCRESVSDDGQLSAMSEAAEQAH